MRSAGVRFSKNSRSAFASSSQERQIFTVMSLRFIEEYFIIWVPSFPRFGVTKFGQCRWSRPRGISRGQCSHTRSGRNLLFVHRSVGMITSGCWKTCLTGPTFPKQRKPHSLRDRSAVFLRSCSSGRRSLFNHSVFTMAPNNTCPGYRVRTCQLPDGVYRFLDRAGGHSAGFRRTVRIYSAVERTTPKM